MTSTPKKKGRPRATVPHTTVAAYVPTTVFEFIESHPEARGKVIDRVFQEHEPYQEFLRKQVTPKQSL